MQPSQRIEVYQSRELGDILNITMMFIRTNFKKLGKSLLFIAGPVLLVMEGVRFYLTSQFIEMPLQDMFSGTLMLAVVSMVLHGLGGGFMAGVLAEYMLLYVERGEEGFDLQDVWAGVRRDFGTILLFTIAFCVIVTLGTVFLILPGIYFYVTLSILMMVAIYEDLDFTAAISRCFELVKDHWWMSFGLLFITYLIKVALDQLLQIPVYVIMFAQGFGTSSSGLDMQFGWPFALATSIAHLGGFLTMLPMLAAASLHYFNLVEKQEGTGILRRIDTIGDEQPEERKTPESW